MKGMVLVRPKSGSRSWHGVGHGFAASLANILLGGAAGVISSRLLGPSGRGALALGLVWCSTLTAIGALGLPHALSHSVARQRGVESQAVHASELWGRALILGTVLGIIASATGIALSGNVVHDLGARPLVVLGALGVTPALISGLQFGILRGLGAYRAYAISFGVQPVIWFGAVAWAYMMNLRTPAVLMIFYLMGLVISVVLGSWFLLRSIGVPRFSGTPSYRSLFAFGLPAWVSGVAFTVNSRIDQIILGALMPSNILGVYSVGTSISSALFPLASGIALVVLPEVAGASKELQVLLTIQWALKVVMISTAAGFVLFLVREPLVILLFGEAFRASVPLLVLLIPAQILLGMNFVLHDAFRGMGRPAIPALTESAVAAVMLIPLVYAVRSWGALGAAWMSLATCAVAAVCLLFGLRIPASRESNVEAETGRRERVSPPERIDPEHEPPGVVAHHTKKYKFADAEFGAGFILDVGCGVGYGAALLSRHGRRIIGVDLAPEALAVATARYSLDGVAFLQANGEQLPFRDGVFDGVTCFETIEHLRNPELHLAETARILKPDGVYIISTPRPGMGGAPGLNPHHYNEFGADTLLSLLDPYFAEVVLLGQRRRQSVFHRLAQRADFLGLRRFKFLRPLARCICRLLGTNPIESVGVNDFVIDEQGATLGTEFVVVCRRPRKGHQGS